MVAFVGEDEEADLNASGSEEEEADYRPDDRARAIPSPYQGKGDAARPQ